MNLSRPLLPPVKHVFRILLKLRRLLPREKCQAFGAPDTKGWRRIERIYVINLNRQPDRWAEIERELRHFLDATGIELADLAERYPAVDARQIAESLPDGADGRGQESAQRQ